MVVSGRSIRELPPANSQLTLGLFQRFGPFAWRKIRLLHSAPLDKNLDKPEEKRRGHHNLDDLAFAIAVVSILVVGSAARFYHLSALPIWMDEAYSYFVSKQPLDHILFNKIDNKPPLFYALQHLWTAINPNLAAIRVPAAVLGSLTVLIIILATVDLLSRRAGSAAGALLALSAGHIYFSQDARMYTLLAFGLALATWGLIGFADRNGRGFYAVTYLMGAAVAVYCHPVALIYLAILNGLTLGCALLIGGEKRRFYLSWLIVNFLLLVGGLPWFLSLSEATSSFPGLRPQDVTATEWFVRNLIGFPGLPSPIKTPVDAFILAIYLMGAVLVWRSGRKTFAVVTIGMLAIYPTALAIVNIHTPILANRTFIPCVIPASMLFGGAVVSLRRPLAQTTLLIVVLSLATWSALTTNRLQVKPEDTPQALALIDAHGFADAPILSCHFFTAGTAFLYAPGKTIVFFGTGNELIRFDNRILDALSLPAVERQHVDSGSMRRLLIERGLIIHPSTDWSSVRHVSWISAGCDAKTTRSKEWLLTSLGFHKVDAPVLKAPERVVFESLWTELSLWSREIAAKEPSL